jgi:hydroxyethylthiazole kinase
MPEILEKPTVWQNIQRVRAEAPLVLNITNYVVMNTTANALLAVGASPVMAHAQEEVEEMAALAKALVINIGTLSAAWIDSMMKAGLAARQKGIPIVLDPVGSGATRFRTETAQALVLNSAPSIIRGNASEIRSLVLAEQSTKGVESVHASEETLEAAQVLSANFGGVVSVSGRTDLIVEGGRTIRILNGHQMMSRVTGMGCTATALTAAFAAVNPSYLTAAANAMAVMGIAGEIAGEHCAGPASFEICFLDALYSIQEADIAHRMKMEIV